MMSEKIKMSTVSFLLVLMAMQVTQAQSLGNGAPDGWKLEHEEGNVRILSKHTDCSDKANGTSNEYLLLKVVNDNPSAVSVSFTRNTWYDGKCNSCGIPRPENHTEIIVAANATTAGDCQDENKSLKVFSRMLDMKDVRKMTRFQVSDVSILPVSDSKIPTE